jgi:glycosyltransferase involved in cell wall biosynthesis
LIQAGRVDVRGEIPELMKFSIITPSFNQGRFILDCLESVRLQAGGDREIEHLVMDGGSTDETLAVLAEWQKKVSLSGGGQMAKSGYTFSFLSEADKGMTDAINKGFRRATGDWLMWLNTDDYLVPKALEKVSGFIRKRGKADVVYGDCHFVAEDRSLLRIKKTGVFSFPVLIFYGCYIQSTACFYRRALVEEGFLLDTDRGICMDFDYYVRLALAGKKFAYLPEVLAGFRWHGNNLSSVQSARRGKERRLVQSIGLEAKGWKWMDHTFILAALKNIFRVYRQVRLVCR